MFDVDWRFAAMVLAGLCVILLTALILSLCAARHYRRLLRAVSLQKARRWERQSIEDANMVVVNGQTHEQPDQQLSSPASQTTLLSELSPTLKSLPANGQVVLEDVREEKVTQSHLYAQLEGRTLTMPSSNDRPQISAQPTASESPKPSRNIEALSLVCTPTPKFALLQQNDRSHSGSLPNVFLRGSSEHLEEDVTSGETLKHLYAKLEASTMDNDSKLSLKSLENPDPSKVHIQLNPPVQIRKENATRLAARKMGGTDSQGYALVFPNKPSSAPSSPRSHRRQGTPTSAELKDIISSTISSNISLNLMSPMMCSTPTKDTPLPPGQTPSSNVLSPRATDKPLSHTSHPLLPTMCSTPSKETPFSPRPTQSSSKVLSPRATDKLLPHTSHPLSPLALSGKTIFQFTDSARTRGSLTISSSTELPQLPAKVANTLPRSKPPLPQPPSPSLPPSNYADLDQPGSLTISSGVTDLPQLPSRTVHSLNSKPSTVQPSSLQLAQSQLADLDQRGSLAVSSTADLPQLPPRKANTLPLSKPPPLQAPSPNLPFNTYADLNKPGSLMISSATTDLPQLPPRTVHANPKPAAIQPSSVQFSQSQLADLDRRGSWAINSTADFPQLPPRGANTLPASKPPPPKPPSPQLFPAKARQSPPSKEENDYLTPATLQEEILSSSYAPYAVASVSTVVSEQDTMNQTSLTHSRFPLTEECDKVFMEMLDTPRSNTLPRRREISMPASASFDPDVPMQRKEERLPKSVSGDLESFV